jgi:hypothetical protein
MARMTKREADEFRQKIDSVLAEPHHWRGYEDQRDWLQKLLRREENYYTEAERKAVARIAFARTSFEGWAGYTVPELAKGALRYSADIGPDDEQFLKDAEHAAQLVMDDMKALVGFCIFAGMDVPRFNPGPNPYRYDDGP